MKYKLCTPDIELIAVSTKLNYYLPREFTKVCRSHPQPTPTRL